MAEVTDFPKGAKVRFLPGPKALMEVEATVIGHENGFLVTKDGVGKHRKTRPGNATKVV